MSQNALEIVFGRPKVFLPVVKPRSRAVALQSIQTAIDSGADGVFVTNDRIDEFELLDFIPQIQKRFGSIWIGVNMIGYSPVSVLDLIKAIPVDGIWSDNAGIDEMSTAQPAGELFRQARLDLNWKGLYFGGIDFKYQRPISLGLLPRAAQNAVPYMDVLTTSGLETGSAPSIDKVAALRLGAQSHPIALASGITPCNVIDYLPIADCFIVASSIETKSSGLNPEGTKLLSRIIHSWPDQERQCS